MILATAVSQSHTCWVMLDCLSMLFQLQGQYNVEWDMEKIVNGE
jgi:hypothetical protein